MSTPVLKAIAGTTITLTWVNSGVTPSSLKMTIRDRDETLVSSVMPVSSGNGHYYAPLYVPSSWQWYVAETIAVIDARTYVNRALVNAYKLEAN